VDQTVGAAQAAKAQQDALADDVERIAGSETSFRELWLPQKINTLRVAISHERIVGIDGGQVAFRVRADPACGKKRTLRLPNPAFIERIMLHVLP